MQRNEKIIKEFYAKEYKFFRVNENYWPCYKCPPLTRKFYARHEALDLSTADEELVRTIKMYRDMGPKEKYKWPVTENQWCFHPCLTHMMLNKYCFKAIAIRTHETEKDGDPYDLVSPDYGASNASFTYGWFVDPLVELDRTDERLYFPKIVDEVTKHDMKIRADITMKFEKFTGIPFKA